ncbi:MAG: HigA family addiction module antidote protein [Planctomycetaceae bacterium]|nr:HigA family addiction module antidote protein [Planctomycetaceae bacterium]
MASIAPGSYRPQQVSPPGNTIRATLEGLGISQAELARRMGRPAGKINEIIQGKRGITAETALELESVLGLPASFWLNREQAYRLAISEQAQLQQQQADCEIAREFPCTAMANLGWIERSATALERYRELLRFFGTAKLRSLTNAVDLATKFRRKQNAGTCHKSLAAWLRKGNIEAQRIATADFDQHRMEQSVDEFRKLTMGGPGALLAELPRVAAGFGISVVFVPHLPKTYVGGAAYWHNRKPVIQLSFRGMMHDILWFNFFHELGHILLHSREETWLDDFSEEKEAHELEANKFAAETLIPEAKWAAFRISGRFTSSTVKEFANEVGIASSIVAGRLHREGLVRRTQLLDLKISLADWIKEGVLKADKR